MDETTTWQRLQETLAALSTSSKARYRMHRASDEYRAALAEEMLLVDEVRRLIEEDHAERSQ